MDNSPQSFHRSLRRSRGRQRFYSSMNHNEYVEYFGMPAPPVFKPLADPEEIPDFILDQPIESSKESDKEAEPAKTKSTEFCLDHRLDPIPEIEGSQNQTIIAYLSPRKSFQESFKQHQRPGKRSHSRMRSQSENSEYLIFNFLDRYSKKEEIVNGQPKKKVKCQ